MKRYSVFIDDDVRPFLGTDDLIVAIQQHDDACKRYYRIRVRDNETGETIETIVDRRTMTRVNDSLPELPRLGLGE